MISIKLLRIIEVISGMIVKEAELSKLEQAIFIEE